MSEVCDRCQRAAPPIQSDAYIEWESHLRDDGSIGPLCPGCPTGNEQEEIAAAAAEIAADAEQWLAEVRSLA